MAAVAMQHPRGIVSSAALRNAETLFETQTVVEIREVIPVGFDVDFGSSLMRIQRRPRM
jgi:hypothetical protein